MILHVVYQMNQPWLCEIILFSSYGKFVVFILPSKIKLYRITLSSAFQPFLYHGVLDVEQHLKTTKVGLLGMTAPAHFKINCRRSQTPAWKTLNRLLTQINRCNDLLHCSGIQTKKTLAAPLVDVPNIGESVAN